MEITGTAKHVSGLITVGNFTKKELVIETAEQYPQTLCIAFAKDKADLLNGLKQNQKVTVSVNIRGSKWQSPQGETKYFTSLSGWKIATDPGQYIPTPTAQPAQAFKPVVNLPSGGVDFGDGDQDLPF